MYTNNHWKSHMKCNTEVLLSNFYTFCSYNMYIAMYRHMHRYIKTCDVIICIGCCWYTGYFAWSKKWHVIWGNINTGTCIYICTYSTADSHFWLLVTVHIFYWSPSWVLKCYLHIYLIVSWLWLVSVGNWLRTSQISKGISLQVPQRKYIHTSAGLHIWNLIKSFLVYGYKLKWCE